jgi:hypothetical protein
VHAAAAGNGEQESDRRQEGLRRSQGPLEGGAGLVEKLVGGAAGTGQPIDRPGGLAFAAVILMDDHLGRLERSSHAASRPPVARPPTRSYGFSVTQRTSWLRTSLPSQGDS